MVLGTKEAQCEPGKHLTVHKCRPDATVNFLRKFASSSSSGTASMHSVLASPSSRRRGNSTQTVTGLSVVRAGSDVKATYLALHQAISMQHQTTSGWNMSRYALSTRVTLATKQHHPTSSWNIPRYGTKFQTLVSFIKKYIVKYFLKKIADNRKDVLNFYFS